MRVKSKTLLAFSAAAGCMYWYIPMISADMSMIVSTRTSLNNLISLDMITSENFDYIVENVDDEILDAESTEHDMPSTRPSLSVEKANELRLWLGNRQDMTQDTEDLLRNMFELGAPPGRKANVPRSVISADYKGDGIVKLLARKKFSDDTSFSKIYNGIWGYKTGEREYALQCDHIGLNILDVTTNDIVVVQTIKMRGGDVYRDVATRWKYAYVAAQYGDGGVDADAWVVDLSELSSDIAQSANSNPISNNRIKNLGYENWGHTLNVWNGLLFLNHAEVGMGCKIFDVRDTPMNPKELITYKDGDCHDSYAKKIQGKDILFSSDGRSGSWRFLDITDIREPGFQLKVIGQTETQFGSYAHSTAVSEDSKTLFVFEESNKFDMAAYDISNLEKPQLITQFQYGDDEEVNSRVHNGYVLGKYLHVAHYVAGYRVFDISDASNGNIKEVGKYETYRDPDGDGDFRPELNHWEGGWNVFVGLPNKILVSDTVEGTFVMEIDESLLPKCPPGKALFKTVVNTGSNSNEVTVTVKKKKKKKWKNVKKLYWDEIASDDVTILRRCVKKATCYKLIIEDKIIEDEVGNDSIRSYKLSWDGETIRTSEFENEKVEETKFNCD